MMPNITDVGTINALAKMSSNAYTKENSASWWDLDGRWNVVSAASVLDTDLRSMSLTSGFVHQTDSFGWLEDGIRGHVFANNDNSTIVVAIKVRSYIVLLCAR